MTDRGLPIVDGAPACPFVAFEDDRDGRGTAPDHRHRCFAEAHPAPRALAHQEAYCLSSAFPVCPTFQDWARREAAAARPAPAAEPEPPEEPQPARPMPSRDREAARAPSTETPPPIPPRRNPPRNWAAPPPWSAEEPGGAAVEPPPFLAGRDPDHADEWGPAARGLAGSAAARLAGPDPDEPVPARPARMPAADTAPRRDAALPRDQVHHQEPQEAEELFGPAWERPRRYEAYPSLRTRVGLPSFGGVPRLAIAAVAVVLAAAVLFFAGPMLLGLGGSLGPGGNGTPSPSVDATASLSPTPPPAPTPQVYVVAKGDTISKIAKKFGLTVDQLLGANKQIKDPNKIKIGDEITIPVPTASDVTEGGGQTVTSAP